MLFQSKSPQDFEDLDKLILQFMERQKIQNNQHYIEEQDTQLQELL